MQKYLLRIVYPDATFLTRRMQIVMGLLLLGINLGIYGLVARRVVKSRPTGRDFPERKSHS